mgnify:CR=1 FL=1
MFEIISGILTKEQSYMWIQLKRMNSERETDTSWDSEKHRKIRYNDIELDKLHYLFIRYVHCHKKNVVIDEAFTGIKQKSL